MQRVALVFILAGCTTHHRISAAATLAPDSSTVGGEATAEGAVGGDDGVMIVGGATARVGHDLSGVALRVGAGVDRKPSPLGVRVTGTFGPTLFDRDGGFAARFETRGSVAAVYGFAQETVWYDQGASSADKMKTIGLELFASSIGFDGDFLLGLGLTFGWYTTDHPKSIASN